MSMDSFMFKGDNGQDVFCWYWSTPDKPPKGVVQIFHGMAEHAARYAELAGFLNERGYAVYASDQRGHGKTGAVNHNLGDLDEDGFNGIVRDQSLLTKRIRDEYPGIPLFILAHSFGSFIGQEYIKRYGDGIDGIILSGSCWMEGAFVGVGAFVAALSRLAGKSRPNRLADRLSFGSYNKRVRNPVSRFDWLSRDAEQVAKYEKDEFCGFVASCNFYYYFSKGLLQLSRNLEGIPKNLPVYIFSGAEDPVGQYGAGVTRLHGKYGSMGLRDLEFKLYPGGRHEMINEINRTEVYSDIAAWFEKHA
jgi:alpha-beta hydrolase superfamily lysophospholipase